MKKNKKKLNPHAATTVVGVGIVTYFAVDLYRTYKTERAKRAEIQKRYAKESKAIAIAGEKMQEELNNGAWDKSITDGSIWTKMQDDLEFHIIMAYNDSE